MRKSGFTEGQIVEILKQGEAGGTDRPDPAPAQHQQSDVLPVAGEVRRRVRRRAEAVEGARGREFQAEADICRARPGECRDQGRPEPKAVTPSAKREVVVVLV